jgi:hypothetical protein
MADLSARSSATKNRSDGVGASPLAPTASSFAHLLPALDRRLHVVPAALQLAQNAFRSHLPLEVLDGALDPLLANGDLKGLTLD